MNEFDLLKKYNDEFREQAANRLISGSAKDYAEYRELIGVIRGMDHANYSLLELKKRLETE